MNGESHRVYWQQWANNSSIATNDGVIPATGNRSRRDLITSSAAVRITPEAKAEDVTKLLRESSSVRSALVANEGQEEAIAVAGNQSQDDSIVLVGTLYSLSPSFIKYEHEQRLTHEEQKHSHAARQGHVSANNEQAIAIQPYQSTTTPSKLQRRVVSSSQPVHVIRTLRPDENPNAIRKLMIERLRSLQCQGDSSESAVGDIKKANTEHPTICPKLQFFYLHPSMHNPILDLDGYMTSLEDDDEDDSIGEGTDEDEEVARDECELELVRRFPWLSTPTSAPKDTLNGSDSQSDSVVGDRCPPVNGHQRRRDESVRQWLYLRQTASQSSSTCLSGYLLKRSPEDPNVWRRVHCVLTEDRLWFVSRIYEGVDGHTSHTTGHARYRCIRLARALLIVGSFDPSASSRAHFHTASHLSSSFCFEVVSASGLSHAFRATNNRARQSWIAGLQARITQSGEKSLMDHAALIMKDESVARSKRATSNGALPLWNALQDRSCDINAEAMEAGRTTTAGLALGSPMGKVLRWGLEVSNFKETCRFLHSRLPAKSPVVVGNPRGHFALDSLEGKGSSHTSASSFTEPSFDDRLMNGEPLDPSLAQMIQDSWEVAHALLAIAVKVGREIREKDAMIASTSTNLPQLHRDPAPLSSIETHCRHIEFILTGRFRPLAKEAEVLVRVANGRPKIVDARTESTPPARERREIGAVRQRLSPPPVDMFDDLLRDLQDHAASAAIESMACLSRNPISDIAAQEKAQP
jgi:PH domain